MDSNLIFSDPKMREEFLDRSSEIRIESFDRFNKLIADNDDYRKILVHTPDNIIKMAIEKVEKNKDMPFPIALKQVIERFSRPAYFVKNNSFNTHNTPSTSKTVDDTVNNAKDVIETALPSVGRINLDNHRLPWNGSGWVVAKNVLVTNRHVASAFAAREGDAFVFIKSDGQTAKAELDTVCEHDSQKEKVYKLRKVLWIAPPTIEHDIAFLSIDEESNEDDPQPAPIELMDKGTFEDIPDDHWIAVIGYPKRSSYHDIMDQQLIFDGIYGVKRVQPGQIKSKNYDTGIVSHDASTLRGNSGSVVLDLTSGKAMALHFGGILGTNKINNAVAAPIIKELLHRHIFS